eukprot:4481444-Pyramimonas_sp.AAC.1
MLKGKILAHRYDHVLRQRETAGVPHAYMLTYTLADSPIAVRRNATETETVNIIGYYQPPIWPRSGYPSHIAYCDK